MKKEIADLWVEALESGQFVQGQGALTDDGKYCCLGVLCKLAIDNGISLEVDRDVDYPSKVSYDGNVSYLPPKVTEWAGMKNDYGLIETDAVDDISLTSMNDSGDSFKKIAKTIRKNVDAL